MSDDVFANLWAIHSETDARPMFRGYARSEEEAKRQLEEIRKQDGDHADNEYWVTRMTRAQVESFKHAGFIPQDA